jgi:hypothetical protein
LNFDAFPKTARVGTVSANAVRIRGMS